VPHGRITPELSELLAHQRQQAAQAVPAPEDDPHVRALSVIEPLPPPRVSAATTAPDGMLRIEPGRRMLTVQHMRRECGCYPDEGTPREAWPEFLKGNPHNGTLEHQWTGDLPAFCIDPQPVTNREFARFVSATGYTPERTDRFLAHWPNGRCPEELLDDPVVYVDIDDARAYAAWAGRRLPTEWEWQAAAEEHGAAFARGSVWEWTESRRDDGHTRFVMLRGGSAYRAEGSIWYFPGGEQPIETHAKFLLMHPGLDRCATIGFRCVVPVAGE